MADKKGFEVGGTDRGYLFEFKKEGVFFTAFPTDDASVLFELTDMQQILKDYGANDYDIVELTKAIRNASGEAVKIAEHFSGKADLDTDDTMASSGNYDDTGLPEVVYHIEISKDRMSATLKFDEVTNRRMPTLEEVVAELNRCNVHYGIDEEAIAKALKLVVDAVVARGTEAIKGEDARVERKFDMSQVGVLARDQYDRVDYKNLNLFILAKKGDVLAVRIPHTKGVAGRNVIGDEIPPRPGKPRPVPAGKNTFIQNDNEVVAAIDGQIVDKGNAIAIDPVLVIGHDVDLSVGNIDFIGTVKIKGNVEPGFEIKATGNIEVSGNISGSTVCGQNVIVNGGIQGMNRGRIVAKENITTTFCENAELEAGVNIYINDVTLHSILTAGEKVIVQGKRGFITGGVVSAGMLVDAKIIGNAANVATRVTVGANPMLMREYKETIKELNEARKKMDLLKKTLRTLEKVDISKLPQNRIDQINALTRSQFPLAGDIERKEKAIANMEAKMQEAKSGKVRASETLFPGVRLSINSILKNVQSEYHNCTMFAEGDEVKMGPY